MSERRTTSKPRMADLNERAKELDCLYRVEELTRDGELPFEQVLRGVLAALPAAWRHSACCQVRITCDGDVFTTPDFAESPWVQRALLHVQGRPVGAIEVYYTEARPPADEGPFLKEERRLLDTVAERLSECITHRRLRVTISAWKAANEEAVQRTKSDWWVILDLLRRTDHGLLVRVTRKMINYLCWSGVKEAEPLLRHFAVGHWVDLADPYLDTNRPQRKDDFPSSESLVSEAFRIAALHLNDEEIVTSIHKWIKQDQASFLLNTLENHQTSLAEVADAIRRYQHASHGEVELTASTMKGLRVSLIRRFLTDQLEFINVAKRYVDLKDFHELLQRTIFPAKGHGKIGGKSSGLFLAGQIVRHHAADNEWAAGIRIPKTWYITSDGLHNFIYCNHLEDVFTHKYKEIDQVRQEYPDLVQVFKHCQFSADILKGLSVALDDFGERPLIVRSSSLLEDRFGAAFSGKYKSLFLANQGTKAERLAALTDAIAEVYASTFNPDAIEYRAERNLLDFQEGMGVMIQAVVGTKVGDYFLPAFAGVAFSHNEFRWSPRIRREDGLMRLVPGLGTRAVDRVGDDYPIVISPGQPGLRVNATPEEEMRYAPRWMDVIYLATNSFETVKATDFVRECGDQMPSLEPLLSVFDNGVLRQAPMGQVDFERDDLVFTFEGLLTRTPFVKQVHSLLRLLERELGTPVDVEFACDGRNLYLLQCRPQVPGRHGTPAVIPHDVPPERVVFSATRFVPNGSVTNLTHVVYVDPARYAEVGSLSELAAIGRAVGKLNKLLPKRQFILMGPGRWGSRGDIKLGVRVTYSDINNTAMLVEIARRRGDYTPEVSFGTHFFQDLVEASIRYLPLFPDDAGVIFNDDFLSRSRNILPDILPEFAYLAPVLRVIDVPQASGGHVLDVLMNSDVEEAVAVLVPPAAHLEAAELLEPGTAATQHDRHWRWRQRMAERVAARLNPTEFGVVGCYLFGSTKNATAGPGSDIDLLVHFRGTDEQRAALERWLDGWSVCLAELNFLRTGRRSDGLLDVQIITDEDIAQRTPYAVKIGAVSDAARPLPIGDGTE